MSERALFYTLGAAVMLGDGILLNTVGYSYDLNTVTTTIKSKQLSVNLE